MIDFTDTKRERFLRFKGRIPNYIWDGIQMVKQIFHFPRILDAVIFILGQGLEYLFSEKLNRNYYVAVRGQVNGQQEKVIQQSLKLYQEQKPIPNWNWPIH